MTCVTKPLKKLLKAAVVFVVVTVAVAIQQLLPGGAK